MKPIAEFFRRIDDRVLGVLNDAYLWMLDWTGIYVATVTLICCAPTFAYMWNSSTSRWIIGIWFLLLMALVTEMYWMQGLSKAAFNIQAEMNKGGYIRTFLIWFNIMTALFELFQRASILSITCDICGVLFWYVICIKIRDREKKKFELKLSNLAMEGTS